MSYMYETVLPEVIKDHNKEHKCVEATILVYKMPTG